MKWKRFFVQLVCWLFILLFLYAAASKLMEFGKFNLQLAQSPLLTDYAGVLAWLVPGVEIIIAGLLAFDRTKRVGLYAGGGLMVLFTVYIYLIMNFADHVPCSCGGILEKMTWEQHFWFNVGFVVLGLIALLFETRTLSVLRTSLPGGERKRGA